MWQIVDPRFFPASFEIHGVSGTGLYTPAG